MESAFEWAAGVREGVHGEIDAGMEWEARVVAREESESEIEWAACRSNAE